MYIKFSETLCLRVFDQAEFVNKLFWFLYELATLTLEWQKSLIPGIAKYNIMSCIIAQFNYWNRKEMSSIYTMATVFWSTQKKLPENVPDYIGTATYFILAIIKVYEK